MKRATPPQVDFLENLQDRLDWSDAEVADEAREQGVVVDVVGAVPGPGPAYGQLSIGDASTLIEVMKEKLNG